MSNPSAELQVHLRHATTTGASVIAADINFDTARKTAELIKEQFQGVATPCKADVSSEADVEAMCQLAVNTYGRLDIMCELVKNQRAG